MTAWTETIPAGPFDAGTVSRDTQVSDAWSRRFVLPRNDGRFAVLDLTFYVETDAMHESGKRWLTRVTEYTICRDLADVGGSEDWADLAYERIEAGDQDAYDYCKRASVPTGEMWDGYTTQR